MTGYPERSSEASMSDKEGFQEGQAYSRDYVFVGREMAAG